MEMWCPDDVERDSWDWARPPTGREHDSTLQSGVEAPRQFQRSLSRLDFCCCCVLLSFVYGECCVMCGARGVRVVRADCTYERDSLAGALPQLSNLENGKQKRFKNNYFCTLMDDSH